MASTIYWGYVLSETVDLSLKVVRLFLINRVDFVLDFLYFPLFFIGKNEKKSPKITKNGLNDLINDTKCIYLNDSNQNFPKNIDFFG